MQQSAGLKNAYGPSIILFTCVVRLMVLPLNFRQISSTQATSALAPKMKEIKEKYPDDKDLQNQLTALLYEEAKVNPLAGCLPALFQVPVFIALYRSFLNLAQEGTINEPFLWVPNLVGPTFGERSTDWLTSNWVDGVPPMGWEDTIAYLSLPLLLVIAQSISLRVLTPPSDDPQVQQTQRILKYLPLLLGYFALSVPAGLGVYWVVNNLLSTITTFSIKQYFKANPMSVEKLNIDELANSRNLVYYNPVWGYR
jgi:YidC/Oxa1 family membrane protein insertase